MCTYLQESFNSNLGSLIEKAKFYLEHSIYYKNKQPLTPKIAVAVSGGADSLALAFLASQYAILNGFSLYAYTVNHNLREGAYNEALYVAEVMAKLGVKHKILNWEHGEIKFGHIEKEARNARYNLLVKEMLKDQVQILLTAHTENDLIETFLLRRLRKSKKIGLAGISAIRDLSCGISLLRPLLNVQKNTLIEFLTHLGVEWANDPSNDNEKFERVKIRKHLLKREKFYNLIKKKVLSFGLERESIEKKIYNFMQNHVIFDDKLFFVKIPKESFYNFEFKNDLMQKLILLIGGGDYMVNLDSLNDNLLSKPKFTIGKAIIDQSSEGILMYRENKGIADYSINAVGLFDNRLAVTFKHKDSFVVKPIKKEGLSYLYLNKIIDNLTDIKIKESSPVLCDATGNILAAKFCDYSKDNIEHAEIEFAKRFIPFCACSNFILRLD